MKIDQISLQVISDSRGKDTLEAVLVSDNHQAKAAVPSGESTGKNEATVLSPKKALDKVSWLNLQIRGHDFATLEQFDQLLLTLDGTEKKENLGGNFILALSIAFTRLLAVKGNLELFELISRLSGLVIKKPRCFFNLIEGGVHTDPPAGKLPFQEYLYIPNTASCKEGLDEAMLVIEDLEEKIKEEFGQVNYGDEGGFAIPSSHPRVGLALLDEVKEGLDKDLSQLSLDVAANSLYKDGKYQVGEQVLSREELLKLYEKLDEEFNLLSIEDPFAEEDWKGFVEVTQKLGDKVWIVGDDLTTTNTQRLKMAEEKMAANALIVKPNQIGSVSETIHAARLAKSYGWKIIVSHRSGETMDTFIADLAVGLGADGFKSGCPLQRERLVKYQRLVEIEEKCHI